VRRGGDAEQALRKKEESEKGLERAHALGPVT